VLEHLSNYGPWNWIFLAMGLFALSLVVPGIGLLWFRMSATAVGILALATGMTLPFQLIAFCVFAVLSALWVRRYSRPEYVHSDEPDLNVGGHHYVGRTFVVVEAIEGGRGKVRAGDTVWSAEGPDSGIGTSVVVTGVRGTLLLVHPV
jgi:membrane protein implicated in regulation of membrane protease activity